jgi:hypothetical protein
MGRYELALGKDDEPQPKEESHVESVSKPEKIANSDGYPIQLVWVESLSDEDFAALKREIDLVIVDPSHVIVANYEIHWEQVYLTRDARAHIVTALNASPENIEDLKNQIDNALMDPDYTIICNYEAYWRQIP